MFFLETEVNCNFVSDVFYYGVTETAEDVVD